MKIQTRIFLFIIATSLPIILGASYSFLQFSEDELKTLVLADMEVLANSKKSHLLEYVERNFERFEGVASRTQFRDSLDQYNIDQDSIHQDKIKKIISDAKLPFEDIRGMMVFDIHNNLVTSTDEQFAFDHLNLVTDLDFSKVKMNMIEGPNGDPEIIVYGPIVLDGNRIGSLIFVEDGNTILKISADYRGFGETGEVFFAKRSSEGALFITPLRFDADAQLNRVIPFENVNVPIIRALDKQELSFLDTIDYRDKEVISATRYIEPNDWGLAVKIDKDEAFAPIQHLRQMTIIAVSVLIVVALVTSLIFARQFSKPLFQFKKIVKEISHENYEVPIPKGDDDTKEIFSEFEKMKDSLKESKRVEQSKEEFLSMITHELRTPLTPILGWCEALQRPKILGEITGEQREAVNTIYSNASKLRRLIGDVLDVQKLDLKKMEFSYLKFNAYDLGQEVQKDYSKIMELKNINFENNITIKTEIESDKNRINQILGNLINNAIDFLPEKNPKITMDAKEEDEKIIFSVSDNGKGIPEEKQKTIFKKFYQLDTSARRKHGGAGLGLAVCEGIVLGLGGKIWLSSKIGEGTTFYFSIPKKHSGGNSV